MTRNEFAALCGELLIEPALALENTHVTEALKARVPIEELRRVLESEF